MQKDNILKLLQPYIGKLFQLTLKPREADKWGYEADEPIPIRFVGWGDEFKKMMIDSYEHYLEEAGVVEEGMWKKNNIVCIAMIGSDEKNIKRAFHECGGFLFVDTKKMKDTLGPLLVTNTDEWGFEKVAKSIEDLRLSPV